MRVVRDQKETVTRFFAALAALALLGTCGFAQAASQADAPLFEIKPHHTGISVAHLEESIAWRVTRSS